MKSFFNKSNKNETKYISKFIKRYFIDITTGMFL